MFFVRSHALGKACDRATFRFMSRLTLTPLVVLVLVSFLLPPLACAAAPESKPAPAKQIDPETAAKRREERRIRILKKYDANRNGKLDPDEAKRFREDIAAEKAEREAKAAKKK